MRLGMSGLCRLQRGGTVRFCDKGCAVIKFEKFSQIFRFGSQNRALERSSGSGGRFRLNPPEAARRYR
jgi:hypothetical protein